jgi:hypothetical protein
MISKTVMRWLTIAITQFGVILIAAAGGFIFNPSPLSAATEDSSAIKVVLKGDTAPTSPSTTFSSMDTPSDNPFDEPMVASNGDVVFESELSDGNEGLFFKENSSASVELISATNVAIPGAFTPDSGYDGPAISQNGNIAFVAVNESGPNAVIRRKRGKKVLEVIAKNGDTAPVPGGAVFGTFDDLDINNKGDIAFLASYTSDGGSTFKSGVFLFLSAKKGKIVAILLNGDTLPGTGGGLANGTFADDQDGPWLNDKDDVAFAADVISGAASFDGSVFLKRSKKPIESVLLMGTPLLGGTLSSIGVGRPGLNNQDILAFSGEFTGGTPATGVGVVDPKKGIIKCALQGDTAPDTTGTFDTLDDFPPDPFGNPTISNNAVEFHAEMLGDAPNTQGIFTCVKVGKKLEVREAVLTSDPKPTGSWGKDLEEDSSSNGWIVFVDEDSSPGPIGVFITKKPGPEPKHDKN